MPLHTLTICKEIFYESYGFQWNLDWGIQYRENLLYIVPNDVSECAPGACPLNRQRVGEGKTLFVGAALEGLKAILCCVRLAD